ncbi:TetR family transcriptional regulator [Gordonia sp. DT30]|uniref:TetR family transcriptional regulator n=1 Tax=unclassified Gordonia (in: high G+C Gram-positive bacteria) TaxID=2657482 RepID=UPI003CF2BC0D
MIRDAAATRARLLSAARAEFATHGIAGARVDRIATNAESNKAQIYHYFGSKEKLFDAVLTDIVDSTAATLPIDVDDLPGYAAKLVARYAKYPDIKRLATWHRLERGNAPLVDAVLGSSRHKVDEIARAQADGRLTRRYPPAVLLALVLQLAAVWTDLTDELSAVADLPGPRKRASLVREAVTALLSD